MVPVFTCDILIWNCYKRIIMVTLVYACLLGTNNCETMDHLIQGQNLLVTSNQHFSCIKKTIAVENKLVGSLNVIACKKLRSGTSEASNIT